MEISDIGGRNRKSMKIISQKICKVFPFLGNAFHVYVHDEGLKLKRLHPMDSLVRFGFSVCLLPFWDREGHAAGGGPLMKARWDPPRELSRETLCFSDTIWSHPLVVRLMKLLLFRAIQARRMAVSRGSSSSLKKNERSFTVKKKSYFPRANSKIVQSVWRRWSQRKKAMCLSRDHAENKQVVMFCNGHGGILRNPFPIRNNP